MNVIPIPDDHDLVGLAGDWHGATRWAAAAIKSFGKAGVRTIFHLDDFAFWPGNSGLSYLRRVEAACKENNVEIFLTPGNHEDWNALTGLFVRGDGPQQITEHVYALPRGWRWSLRGREFVSLGGGPSIDYEFRTPGVDWWPSEAITDADIDHVIAGGPADVMLAHDSPNQGTRSVRRIIAENPLGFSAVARAYANVGRERMSRAFTAVRPRLFVHGHYHVYDEVIQRANNATGTWSHRVLSLEQETGHGNAAILDVSNLRSTLLRVPQ